MSLFVSEQSCRMKQLLLYFEPISTRGQYYHFRCGRCDVCVPKSTGEPDVTEQRYFKKLERLVQLPKYRLKKTPRLASLCFQVLATHQPLRVSDQKNLAGLGRGWQKEWGTLIEDVSKIRSHKIDRALHPQSHVVDSTHEFPLPK